MGDARRNVAFAELAEVEAGAEVLAFAVEHHRLDAVGQRGEERLDAEHGRVVDGVALLRPGQRENGDLALALGLERPRQRNSKAAPGLSRAHGAPLRADGGGSVTFLSGGVKQRPGDAAQAGWAFDPWGVRTVNEVDAWDDAWDDARDDLWDDLWDLSRHGAFSDPGRGGGRHRP